jgi:hypothetical protein
MMRNDDEILDASEYSRLIAGIRDQVPYMNDSDVRGFLKSFVKSFTC